MPKSRITRAILAIVATTSMQAAKAQEASGPAATNPTHFAFKIEERCDIPGGDLRQLPLASAQLCARDCSIDAQCVGFTFVSGWNRCFLKNQVKRRVSLQMISGDVRLGGTMVNEVKASADHDHSGKDQRKISPVASAETCAEKCRMDDMCQAFTYLKGYGDCYLKGSGKLRAKTFTCGYKPANG